MDWKFNALVFKLHELMEYFAFLTALSLAPLPAQAKSRFSNNICWENKENKVK